MPLTPTNNPSTAKSLMSPPPIPPLLAAAITYSKPKPSSEPAYGSHHGSIGAKRRVMKMAIPKNSKTRFGISILCKSETVTMTTREINKKAASSSFDHPAANGETAKRHAVASSKNGYFKEIECWQCLHRPFCKIYETTGINSFAAMGCRHFGQCEPGVMIERFSAVRIPTTLKNEPQTKPNRNKYT